MLDIEQAFPVNPCVSCNVRSIRAGGVAHCQVCFDYKVASIMNAEHDKSKQVEKVELTSNDRLIMSMKDYGQWNVDESHPDIKDYIEHNADGGEMITLNCACAGAVHLQDVGSWDKLSEHGIVFYEKGIVHKTIAGCYGEEDDSEQETDPYVEGWDEKDLIDEYGWPDRPANA